MKIRNITKLKTKYRLYSSDRFRFNKIELHSTESGSVTFSRNWIMCYITSAQISKNSKIHAIIYKFKN